MERTEETLVELLQKRAQEQPDSTAYIFLKDGETESNRLLYKELDSAARAIAYYLQELCQAGDRALLLYPSGLEFIAAFFGCLYAGVVAVPAYPPKRNQKMTRLQAIVSDAGATVALTTGALLKNIENRFAGEEDLTSLRCVATDNIDNIVGSSELRREATPETLALLQYTSGSTGKPKGVMVSHGNLLHNSEMLRLGFGNSQKTVYVGWLPLFHDMGLIANVLQALYLGSPCILMSPGAFIQQPRRWLQAISRYKGTTSGGPNFAYDLCVNKITPEEKANLDLSSWEVAFNGAEPVRSETLEQFTRTFADCGFRRETFYPCYGMAETTVFVSGVVTREPPVILQVSREALEQNRVVISNEEKRENRKIVSCGRAWLDEKIIIVEPESLTKCRDNKVGEIWVSSSSVAQGYWRKPEQTEETFFAYLAETGDGPFLRTGDLGFTQDGELFVTGRAKDLIIVRGRNYYPQDIEQTVEQSHPSVRPNCSAAFSVDVDGAERVVVAAEVERQAIKGLDVSGVVESIREAVWSEYELQVYGVLLLRTASIPKTSSGKIQRHACRQGFVDSSLLVVGSWQQGEQGNRELPLLATESLSTWLAEWIGSELGVAAESIDPQKSLFYYGLDSVSAMQLARDLEERVGRRYRMSVVWEYPTISELLQYLSAETTDAAQAEVLEIAKGEKLPTEAPLLPAISRAPEQRNQPFPLTDIQQAYWLGRSEAFELGNVATHIYLEIDSDDLDIEGLNQAWQKLIERHDMLRMVLLPDGQQQVREIVPSYQITISDLRGENPEAITTKLSEIRSQMSHQVLPGSDGLLFDIRATRWSGQKVRLHLSFDLLIADAWSLLLLFDEWKRLYQNPLSTLTPLQLSFRDYVVAERQLKESELYRGAKDYWDRRVSSLPDAPQLPWAKHPSEISQPRFVRRSAKLSQEKWQKLKQRATIESVTPSGLLVAAFAEVLSVWSKSGHFTINLTLFNRLPLHPQVNDIVGDFTSLTLLEVDNSTADTFTNRAVRIQKQLWQDLDHRYFTGVEVLRELGRRQGSRQSALMPVVFTSTLALGRDLGGINEWGEMVYGISQTPQVWLDHQVMEEKGGLVFNWDAVEELFPSGMLDDMFNSYCHFLEELTEESAWISNTRPRLPEAQLDQRQLVNATAAPPQEMMLHELFAAQVAVRPLAEAIITPQQHLSYRSLYQRANQVARKLRQLGATPNSLVAVVMSKGWEQIVAVLGILISGAAYLPIDPEIPCQRLEYILVQGEVKLALTQSDLREVRAAISQIQWLEVDSSDVTQVDSSPLEPVQTPEDLAYVIYTSGSTGQPKGVAISHRGAVNTICDINQRFGVGVSDRVLAVSALNFDLSVYDIFGILAAGGTVVMPAGDDSRRDPAHWVELMRANQVTLWNSVPALMGMLVEYLSRQPELVPSSVGLILLSGDWLPLDLPAQIKALWSSAQVVSLGGATEASIWSILYPIEKVDPTWKSIPYGKPMQNQYFQVLNPSLEPVPVWVPGQLYIGGMGLATGYWQDEEKTSKSFITHRVTKERLYKTGDLGRYLPSGDIEFLGREDFQVKVNGYRIELGEIEQVLKQHPAVKEVVVTAVGPERGNKQLVAYVVSHQDRSSTAEAHNLRDLEGVILDPVARMEFRLKQPGLRQSFTTQSTLDLALPEFDEGLRRVYLERQSYRQFQTRPISFEQFSQFLSCLLSRQLEDYPLPKYQYPSAGSLYPVQTYLFIKPHRIEGAEAGIYYYQPRDHRLVLLSSTGIKGDVYQGNEAIYEQSAFSLLLIGEMKAISPMYGERARDFCLLEAGHIGQLLMQAAPQQEIGLCPIGSIEFQEMRQLLKLEASQDLLYSFLGGKIDVEQTKRWFSSQKYQGASSVTLRQDLMQKLPEYMVPSTFVLLDALPLTPNGKVDRRALPAPDFSSLSSDAENLVLPRNPTEEQLAAIWYEVLGVEQVGVFQDFFELGGDSILATKIIVRVRDIFSVELLMRNMFESPTIAAIAEYIDKRNKIERDKFRL